MNNGAETDGAAIAGRVSALREELARASARWGRPPLLLAVSKTQPAERVNLLREAGVDQIGESRAQEWREKFSQLWPGFVLHWIGRLQTNKIRYIIDRVYLVHSLDRPALAEALGGCARELGRRVSALVQVNIAGEAQKAGLAPEDVPAFLRQYGGYPGLAIEGLMAIMPEAADPETLRPYFRRMREMFDETARLGIPSVSMRHLSMGMSADRVVAAQEGATIVRVGSALFGPREGPPNA
jgi:pyridoxal phosphate enzyme (YggS family)